MAVTDQQASRYTEISPAQFRRKFRNLILLAWNLPPVIGLSFIAFIGILSPKQVLDILITPTEPLYIIGWIFFSLWYFPRLIRPITDCVGQQDCGAELSQRALVVLRNFPLKFWGIFLFYLALAPASVLLSAEYFTDYVAQPVDWFRIQLIALIVSIIVGLPIFFMIYDLFGHAFSGIVLKRPYVSLKVKVFMIGALVPLLIDTMLVQYFWTRTGFFETETFFVWLALEVLAIIGSLIFVHSIGQSLSPLQQLISYSNNDAMPDVDKLRPKSTDEMGILTADYSHLLRDMRQSEQLYRQLVESTNSIPWELDLDTWRFTYVGPQAIAMLGYPVEDWYQEAFWQAHIYHEDKEDAVSYCVASTGRGEDHEFEYRMVAADGRLVWIKDSVNIITEEGKRTKLQGFMFDITQHKQAQEALSQSEEKFSQVFHASPVAILISDMNDGRVIDVNHAFEHLFAYNLQEIEGRTTREFGLWLHPEDREPMVEQVRARGYLVDEVRVLLSKHGEQIQCQFAVHPIELDGENCLITVFQNVTQRTRVEDSIKALARSSSVLVYEEFLREAVRSLAQVYHSKFAFIGRLLPDKQRVKTLVVWGGEGYVENFVYELKGTPCKDIMDFSKELIPSDAWKLYPDDALLKQMGVESYFGAPLLSSKNELLGLISVMDTKPMELENWVEPILGLFAARIAAEIERQDINEELELHRHHLEDLVSQRTAKMDQLNRELESFSYSVSHDLRAPLRSISGFTQALMEDYGEQFDAEGQDYLNRVCNGANRMSGLIDDLLDLSRVTRSETDMQRVDLSLLTGSVVRDLREREPGRQVTIKIQDNMQVVADKHLLRILLDNLIGNAWKYTSRSQDARIEIGSVANDELETYFIRDNGVGFDMKYAGKLFGAFQRLHQKGEFEGTGIGLATVQRVISHHSGKIWAEAEPDKGATFFFTLPGDALS